MAFMAYAHQLSKTPEAIRYDYGMTEDDPERGVLVIPLTDPEAWYMEGRTDRPWGAGKVVRRAWVRREQTGEWPAEASVFS